MADKSVFIAFSMNDEKMRNLFTGQRTNNGTPFEYIDLSVKEKYKSEWKDKVTARIRRSDGVIALISSSTPQSEGELWEIETAVAEGKPLLGIWVEDGYRTKPSEMGDAPCKIWSWANVEDFIDSL
jgi:nucleoside 2-deoxyribosyltransferase